MLMKFLYLENRGTPTRWDITLYTRYRDSNAHNFTVQELDLISDERFDPSNCKSLHDSMLESMQLSNTDQDGNKIKCLSLSFIGDCDDRVFRFEYVGLIESDLDSCRFLAMPVLITHELTKTKQNFYRHVLATLGGEQFVFVSKGFNFVEILTESGKLKNMH
jgi:hypothetical protein